MYSMFETPIFGIVLTVLAFDLGLKISKKMKWSLAHPLLIATLIIMMTLTAFKIPLSNYQLGGSVITYFLSPLTIVLALPMYRQLPILRKNFVPILVGITVGLTVSTLCTYALGQFFNIPDSLLLSIVPKSLTTPIALTLTEVIGGETSITTIFVILTGILGALIAPTLYRIYKTDNAVAKGVGIGAATHAIGTSKAIELGETEGATSSASIGLTGIIAIILIPLMLSIFN